MNTKYRQLVLIAIAALTQIVGAAGKGPPTQQGTSNAPASTPTNQKSTTQPPASPTLKILHFNVGNGDATLVVFQRAEDKRTLLIDGGNSEAAGNVVIPGIKQEIGSARLDYAIATNYRVGHRDGLEVIVRSVGMSGRGMVYDRDRAWPVSATGCGPGASGLACPLQPGSVIPLDPLPPDAQSNDPNKDRLIIECIAANGNTKTGRWANQGPASDEGAQSLAFLISFNTFRYFIGSDLTGGGRSGWNPTPDLEKPVAADLGQVSVAHINHHGSRTSTNQAFLSTLNPLVAVISTGHEVKRGPDYQWPCRGVLDRLNALLRLNKVYVTGEVGTPQGLTTEDKKKVKSGQGTITIVTMGGKDFQVNGDNYPLQ
jgi:beta-lactamase superfamily II metal-dependent hydrolase